MGLFQRLAIGMAATGLLACVGPETHRVRVIEVQMRQAREEAAVARSARWGLEAMLDKCRRDVEELWDELHKPKEAK